MVPGWSRNSQSSTNLLNRKTMWFTEFSFCCTWEYMGCVGLIIFDSSAIPQFFHLFLTTNPLRLRYFKHPNHHRLSYVQGSPFTWPPQVSVSPKFSFTHLHLSLLTVFFGCKNPVFVGDVGWQIYRLWTCASYKDRLYIICNSTKESNEAKKIMELMNCICVDEFYYFQVILGGVNANYEYLFNCSAAVSVVLHFINNETSWTISEQSCS